MIINNLININEMMSMKCKNLSRLLFRGQSRTCLLDFRDCSLHLDNLLPPEGEHESHLLSDEMPLPLSFIAPIKMHRWPFNTSRSFVSGWKFSFICIFIPQPFSVLHRPHYSQLGAALIGSFPVCIYAGCPVIISCRLPKAGMFSDKFKGRLFLFHVCQFSLLGKYLLCQLVKNFHFHVSHYI